MAQVDVVVKDVLTAGALLAASVAVVFWCVRRVSSFGGTWIRSLLPRSLASRFKGSTSE